MNIQDQLEFGYTEDESGIWEPAESSADGTAAERPYVFLSFNTPINKLPDVIARYVEAGAGGIIPYLPAGFALGDRSGDDLIAERREFFVALLPLARASGLGVAFTIDKYLERIWAEVEDSLYEDDTRSQILTRYDHLCSDREEVTLTLRAGSTVSLTAVHEESGEMVDLRPLVNGDTVTWRAPYGNWTVSEFDCIPDHETHRVNILSYDSSMRFLEAMWGVFADILDPYLGDTVSMLCYRHLCFGARNRRDWDIHFNEVFRERYGFDPAPFYPALYDIASNDAPHIKALFFDCRAHLLHDGFLRAARDFAEKRSLSVFGNISEPKLAQCSTITGDAMLDNTASPCGVFERAYLYGMNSVKVAAGAAFSVGLYDVGCELFRDYGGLRRGLYLRDAEHAIARGANLTAMHLPLPTEKNEEPLDVLCAFGRRMRRILRGARQIADIAVIYPIYSLHSTVDLYDAPTDGYEYPDTPMNADYMTVIDILCNYCGHDVTLLHPDAVAGRATVEGGLLRMTGQKSDEAFRAVILPAARICSLASMRVLRDYYDAGGKIIATGELPRSFFEYDPANKDADREMREIVDHIFGEKADDEAYITDYCYNSNENGGEAFFLYFSLTAADGTAMATSRDIAGALRRLGLAFDIYLPDFPRYESTGALNNPFNEFVRLGLEKHLPDGGIFCHRHARRDEEDIYFFANTTDVDARTTVYLRGAHAPRMYDPLSGKYRSCAFSHVRVRGEIYTSLELELPTTGCAVLVSRDEEKRRALINAAELPDETEKAVY